MAALLCTQSFDAPYFLKWHVTHYALQHIAAADTLEKIEALLPWNMK
jgi:hypothetical protein